MDVEASPDDPAGGSVSIAKKIENGNDPPLVGANEDRSVRGESYVKEFRPVPMGVIDMKKGIGKLVLRAKEIPGQQSIDFRLLMFKRVPQVNSQD